MTLKRKILSVFDMDSTIASMFLESCFFLSVPIEQRLQFKDKSLPWPHRLKRAMTKHKSSKEQVHRQLRSIKMVEGIQQVFKHLHSNGSDLIVLSGANDHLCWQYLKLHDCAKYFSGVIANKMTYDMHADQYDLHLPEVRRCGIPLCGLAPCKKHELETYLNDKLHYTSVYFFGDGGNDLCGMSTINEEGRIFIRKNHELHNSIEKEAELLKHFKRSPEYWEDGRDLLRLLQI